MTTDASYKERGSDWSHQVSVVATTRWLQRDQTLPLSAKGVACETRAPPAYRLSKCHTTVFSPCTTTLFSFLATTATWPCFPLSFPQRTSTYMQGDQNTVVLFNWNFHSCMCRDGLKLTKSPRTIFHFVIGSGGFRLCPFKCLRRAAAAVHGRQDIFLLVSFPGRCTVSLGTKLVGPVSYNEAHAPIRARAGGHIIVSCPDPTLSQGNSKGVW